ncbi:MAG TPA: ABC transporter permease, partial [Candidatus Polarisedimenticolaceae bacterium]|nr:ABC transporter permease [Candidatus Polarisedimenticolaceae bacterium]
MIRYVLHALRAHWRAGRMLFVLTVVGVALGVASVLSIQILNGSALAAFRGGLQAVGGDADLSVMPRGPDLPDAAVPEVLAVPGVRAAWPVLQIPVTIAGEELSFLDVVGVDLFAPRDLPFAGGAAPDLRPALEREGWAAVPVPLARRRGWKVGDTIRLASGSRAVPVRIGALVDFSRLSPTAGGKFVVMDVAQAQALFGRPGLLHHVDVQVQPGWKTAAVAAGIEKRLHGRVQALRPEQRERQASSLLAAFRLNLTALSLISLVVGAFLVYVSTQAALLRRRGEFGLLRSLGATPTQVLAALLVEVALLGILGVAAGLPLGYAVARANVAGVSATVANLYLLQEIESLTVPAWMWALAAATGIGSALAGALLPALDMARRDPRRLLAAFSLQERASRSARALLLCGLALFALAGAGVLAFAQGVPVNGFVLGLAVLAGTPLVTPWALRRGTAALRVRRLGVLYGLRGVGARLQTTAFAAAALAVAACMLVGITLMVGSFRRTIAVWVNTTVRADVYVTTESWRRARDQAVLEPEVIAALRRVPGVARLDRLRQITTTSAGGPVNLGGIDMRLPGGERRFAFVEGVPGDALRRARDEGAVLVGEPMARRLRLHVDGRLTVEGPAGPVEFPVAGIVHDYSADAGSVLMDLATMERAFGPGAVQNVALYLVPGADAEAVVDAIKAGLPGVPLVVRSNRALREEVFRVFDQTFAVTRLLQAMGLLIAVCGVTLTLL